MARILVAAIVAASLVTTAAPSRAASLLPASTVADTKLVQIADTSARAFDRVRAARAALAAYRVAEAQRELAQVRVLLGQARAASPASRVQDRIAELLIRLQDPSAKLSAGDLAALQAELAGSEDGAFDATRRYVERARYQLLVGQRDAAGDELVAAAGRVPYARFDAPIAEALRRVDLALIQLYQGRPAAADAHLAAAEQSAQAVVRIAGGDEAAWSDDVDVAAPPAPPETPSETELPPAQEFHEPAGEAAADAPGPEAPEPAPAD